MKIITRKIIWVTLLSVAFAYVESSVVVYLRMVFYPEGFYFPLKVFPTDTLFIELGREFSTLVMLGVIGILAGKTLIEKLMYFFFSFGVWDIFYYIWLKVFLNWPSSLLEDDILFLIPIPWVGPVITPVIVSITFITASLWILYQIEQGRIFTFSKMDVLLVLSGLLIILISFIWNAFTVNLLAEKDPGFPWAIFLIGEVVLITGIFKGMATKAQRH